MEPSNQETASNGEITFGGTDTSKYTGSITFTSIPSALAADGFWGIEQSVSYGTSSLQSETTGIVDSGEPTTFLIAFHESK